MSDEPFDNRPGERLPEPDSSGLSPPGEDSNIEYDALGEIETGDVIAVRATAEYGDSILAGRVRWRQPDDPHELAQNHLEKGTEFGSGHDRPRVTVLTIDAEIWWVVADGHVSNRSEELQNRPQMQPHLGEPPEDPPNCSLSIRSDGRLELIVPSPVSNGRRVRYYTPDPCGTVIDILHGGLVDPERLLPDDVDPVG